ncbi:hypothetical protein [Pediococcus stilesii]|uniref:hypothetical protein n=1 Tax=Pediococcus stilesii TaxID=331679 RepID=UPI001485DA6F|nr:hypothetical protein [Pediococcus stilesii]
MQLTREDKIKFLLEHTDRKDLRLYEYFLNQSSDKNLDTMISDLEKQFNHAIMEANFS